MRRSQGSTKWRFFVMPAASAAFQGSIQVCSIRLSNTRIEQDPCVPARARQQPNGPTVGNHLVDRRVRALDLSSEEKHDLIAFLERLTAPEFVAERVF